MSYDKDWKYMVNRIGPPVRDDDFFGRESFVDLVWRKVQAGHVLLAAPRRFGKTSVMYVLLDAPRHNFRVIHADLEHMTEPAELLTELIVKLTRERGLSINLPGLGEAFRNLVERARGVVDEMELFEAKFKFKEQARRDWKEIGMTLFAQLADSKRPVLFILDELPMMLDRMAKSSEGRAQAIEMLRWLRQLRIAPEMRNLHFLVAGSIGIDYVLGDLGEITSINDFERLRLEPFSLPVAKQFLGALGQADQIVLSPACHSKIFQLIGEPVPYFLQIMFSEISKVHSASGEKVTPAKIERLYHERVLGMDCKSYFEHYNTRLRDYYKPQQEKAIKRLLRELAVAPSLNRSVAYAIFRDALGQPVELEEFNGLMANLENDFYIRQDATTFDYSFACKLLRDWWLRYYALAV